MEWSEEETIQLIDIYKSKPLLWNPKYEDHFKKHLKEDAWREIAAAMADKTIDDCKKKVVCLLASFRRETLNPIIAPYHFFFYTNQSATNVVVFAFFFIFLPNRPSI